MTYRQGMWAHDHAHFAKHTNYNTAVIWTNPNENGRVYQVNFTNKTSKSDLDARVTDLRGAYYSSTLRRMIPVFMPKDVFNSIVDSLANNTNPGNLKELVQGTATVSTLKDKNVFIVWNKTLAQLVRAVETEAEALTLAKDQATKNTNQAFLVLKPDSIAYQPVSITVDKVTV